MMFWLLVWVGGGVTYWGRELGGGVGWRKRMILVWDVYGNLRVNLRVNESFLLKVINLIWNYLFYIFLESIYYNSVR